MQNDNQVLLFPWDVFKVAPEFVKDGKTMLAYRPNYWAPPATDHTMRFLGTVDAPTEKAAIALLA